MMQKLRNNPEEDTSRMMPISPPKKPQVARQWPMMSKNNIKTSHMHAYSTIYVKSSRKMNMKMHQTLQIIP